MSLKNPNSMKHYKTIIEEERIAVIQQENVDFAPLIFMSDRVMQAIKKTHWLHKFKVKCFFVRSDKNKILPLRPRGIGTKSKVSFETFYDLFLRVTSAEQKSQESSSLNVGSYNIPGTEITTFSFKDIPTQGIDLEAPLPDACWIKVNQAIVYLSRKGIEEFNEKKKLVIKPINSQNTGCLQHEQIIEESRLGFLQYSEQTSSVTLGLHHSLCTRLFPGKSEEEVAIPLELKEQGSTISLYLVQLSGINDEAYEAYKSTLKDFIEDTKTSTQLNTDANDE